jgi:hypothetical protein
MMEKQKKVKLRLLMRYGIADADGRCAGFDYKTFEIEVPKEEVKRNGYYEVIGGEWLEDNPND